jgi:hypothetical protein
MESSQHQAQFHQEPNRINQLRQTASEKVGPLGKKAVHLGKEFVQGISKKVRSITTDSSISADSDASTVYIASDTPTAQKTKVQDIKNLDTSNLDPVNEGLESISVISTSCLSEALTETNQENNMSFDETLAKRHKTVLVISRHDLDQLEYQKGGSELLLNEQISILVPSDTISGALENYLDGRGLLEPGTLSIQNPFDTVDYVAFDKATSTFALAKYLHFTTLCGLLGAREISIAQIEVKTVKGRQIFKGSLSNHSANGEVGVINTTFEEIRNSIKLQSKFDGAAPDIEKANAHLRQYNLSHDISMKSLIDQRKGKNLIKSRELVLSLSEESKKSFKAIADINVPIYAHLQAQIEQFRKEEYEFLLTIKVEF